MITVDEATQHLVSVAPEGWGIEVIPLELATGRVLAEELRADRDFPPFDRVTMDGIAIAYSSFEQGQREFPLMGVQAAGAPEGKLDDPAGCLEVMTGAMLPEGTDTVIRYEDVDIENGKARVTIDGVNHRQNVHFKAYDRNVERLLIEKDSLIGPAEIGVAATIGKCRVRVKKLPRTVILSTGDEIVPIDGKPEPYQIRSSNLPTLQSQLGKWGIRARTTHIVDDLEATKQAVKELIEENDLIILSGGVSKGKFDIVPQALEEAGVKKEFHRVKQRPGKPFWFGRREDGKTVFALPGNPVSTYVCCMRYLQPWLRKALDLEPYTYLYAALAESYSFQPELTYFLQVHAAFDTRGRLWAHPRAGHGSGDHANLADVHGFLELPSDRTDFQEGEVFPLILFRDLP